MAKHQNLNKKSFHIWKNSKVFFFVSLSLFGLVGMILLPSFSKSQLSSSSLILPFGKSSSVGPTIITGKVNDEKVLSIKSKEAFFYKMEQIEGIYAKMMNLSLEYGNGNLVALNIADVNQLNTDSCLASTIFYGSEHEDSRKNYSFDSGDAVFSNTSSLVFEDEQGQSIISRNGWIEISRCEMGRVSGKFQFEIEGEKDLELVEGDFVNVLLKKE